MLRTALLWGNTINLDSDYSKYIETVSDPWVIEGFAVEGGKVKPGKAWVKVTRSNGESLFVLVQNTQDIPVSLNGDVFIGIEVAQNAIDNGLMNNEDGTGIASIKVWPQKPSQNYLLLAVWQGGRLSDKREIIPKLQSLSQRTTTLESKVQQTEGKVEKLVESSIPEFIGKTLTVGESYQNWDVLYDDNGTARKKIVTHSFNLGLSFSEGNRNIWEFSFTPNLPIKIEIEELKMDSADAYIVFGRRYFTSKNDVDNNPNDVYHKIDVKQLPESMNITIPSSERIFVSIVSQWVSYNKVFTCKNAKLIQDKKPEWPAYYPREVKAVGQKVICTLVGIHSDNKFVSKETEIIEINKNIVGNASGSWMAPSDWLLFFQYTSSDHSRFNATAYINGSDVRKHALYWSQYMNSYMRDGIWILRVKKWETYTLRTVVEDYSYKSSLTLRYFISL